MNSDYTIRFGKIVDTLPSLPSVMQHNDLGTWNVVAEGDEFTVADWENARAAGMPLWDLLYFLADALVLVDWPYSPGQFPGRMTRLFAGEAPSSSLLFSWVRRAVDAPRVPTSAVGAITTLCWLSHSHALAVHNMYLAERTLQDPPLHALDGVAGAWMRHPALGPSWSAWSA